ncbi:MAG: hypothetical protein SGI86_19105, partial [Deltaproteobacteria bacterium]|nr:hypothetical protein [Deltaproteobacteria bacterium]
RGLSVWICGGALLGVLSGCFGGGDTRNPGGNAGGAGGGGGGAGTGEVFPCASKADTVAALPIDQEKCAMYATVEEVEKALIRNTGPSGCRNGVCHAVKTAGTRMGLPPSEPSIQPTRAFVELAGVKNRKRGQSDFDVCPNDNYIDIDDPQKSFLLTKVRDEMPACADGTTDPESKQMPNTPTKLTTDQIACVEAYVIAVSNGCRP